MDTSYNPLYTELPLLNCNLQDALPTAANFIIRNDADKRAFRNLLDNKQIRRRPDLDKAYLKFFTIPNKDGTRSRPLVDGKEAQSRNITSPKYSLPLSVPDCIKGALHHEYFFQADLSGAYGQVQIPDNPLLTIRVDGRIYQYISPPQGLAASPAVCVQVFDRIFKECGFTSSYVDNGIGGGDSLAETQAKLTNAKQQLKKYFILNQEETSSSPQHTIDFLGLQVSHNCITLPPNKQQKLKRILESKEKNKIDGYYAYLADIFGNNKDAISPSRSFGSSKIYCDGAKNQFAAAVSICSTCDSVQEVIQQRCRQDSQVNSELKGLLLGERLRRKFLANSITTDALYAVHAQRTGSRKQTLCNSVAKQVGLLKHEYSASNRADPFTRETFKPGTLITCSC